MTGRNLLFCIKELLDVISLSLLSHVGQYKTFIRFIFQYIYEVVSRSKSFFNLTWKKKWQLTIKMEISDIKVSTDANRVLLCTSVVKKSLGVFALKAFSASTS